MLLLLLMFREGDPEPEPEAGVCTFTYDVTDGATYAPTEAYTYDPCADD